MPRNSEIRIFPDTQAVAQTAADEFVKLAREAIQRKGTFMIALSGGTTHIALYSLLADRPETRIGPEIPWAQIHLFSGDDPHASPDHPDSNSRMPNQAMISKVPIPPQNVHRVHAENK